MRGFYKLVLIVLLLHSNSSAQNTAFLARLERVCLSVFINTDQPKDQDIEKEVLALTETILQQASFPYLSNNEDPDCSELGTGTMRFSAYGPNSYPGNTGPFETRLEVSMPTPYEDIPSLEVHSKWADATSQEGDDTTLYQTFKEQVPMWIDWFLDDLEKAKAGRVPEK